MGSTLYQLSSGRPWINLLLINVKSNNTIHTWGTPCKKNKQDGPIINLIFMLWQSGKSGTYYCLGRGATTLQLGKLMARVNFLVWAAPLCELTAEYKSKILRWKKQKGFFKTTRNLSAKNQWSRSWISGLPVMNIEKKTSKKSCEHVFLT